MSYKNKLDPFFDYAIASNLDVVSVFYAIKNVLETIFRKNIFLDDDNFFRFEDTNKKITISKQTQKMILSKLKELKAKESKLLNVNIFMKKFINATVIKSTKTSYFLVEHTTGAKCTLQRQKNITFKQGYKDLFFCYKIKDNRLCLKYDKGVIQKILQNLTISQYSIVVEKFKQNKLIVFTTYPVKPSRDDIKKIIKHFGKQTKLIYNVRREEWQISDKKQILTEQQAI